MSDDVPEQAPGESDRHYGYFLTYLRLGPGRTIETAADAIGIQIGTARNISARHEWSERASEWDRRQFALKSPEETSELYEQAVALTRTAMVKAAEIIIHINPEDPSGPQASVLNGVLRAYNRAVLGEEPSPQLIISASEDMRDREKEILREDILREVGMDGGDT